MIIARYCNGPTYVTQNKKPVNGVSSQQYLIMGQNENVFKF